jgi:hypothetical protein
MFALALMVGGAIWGGSAGLFIGFCLSKVLEWLGLVGSYANSTDWPVIIVMGIGVTAGVLFGIIAARDVRRRERSARSASAVPRGDRASGPEGFAAPQQEPPSRGRGLL